MRSLVVSSLLVLCLVQTGASQEGVHRVVSADSGWQAGGKRLLRGMSIGKNDVLRADTAGDLMLECGPSKEVVHYSCAKGGCGPVDPCVTPPSDSRIAVRKVGLISRAWTALLTREPRQPVLAAARAGGDPNDAVLLLDARGVHWGPALTRVLEGRYCLRAERLPASQLSPSITTTLDWDRSIDGEGVAAAPGLQPGLYALQKGTPAAGGSCQIDADGVAAWVLIATATDLTTLNAQWKEQSAIAADLERTGATRSSVTTVRHAALAGLAETMAAR